MSRVSIKGFETFVPASVEDVWRFHESAEALKVLTPPSRQVRLSEQDLAVREGAMHELRFKIGPLWVPWLARISNVRPPYGFTDTAIRSPFARWVHEHEFVPSEAGTLVRDTVTYALPFGPIGRVVDALFVSRDIDSLFAFRHRATRDRFAAQSSMEDEV
ncbi:MAG: SRPBCC family protein [Fimbriimonadaceae bacterium]